MKNPSLDGCVFYLCAFFFEALFILYAAFIDAATSPVAKTLEFDEHTVSSASNLA